MPSIMVKTRLWLALFPSHALSPWHVQVNWLTCPTYIISWLASSDISFLNSFLIGWRSIRLWILPCYSLLGIIVYEIEHYGCKMWRKYLRLKILSVYTVIVHCFHPNFHFDKRVKSVRFSPNRQHVSSTSRSLV